MAVIFFIGASAFFITAIWLASVRIGQSSSQEAFLGAVSCGILAAVFLFLSAMSASARTAQPGSIVLTADEDRLIAMCNVDTTCVENLVNTFIENRKAAYHDGSSPVSEVPSSGAASDGKR